MLEEKWSLEKENEIREFWKRKRIFNFKNDGKVFVIDTPPPYPSGKPWHIGAAAHYSQIDMIARTMRMFGLNVYFPVGMDRNGIPVERYVEKKFGIKMHLVERKKFIEMCKSALDELEKEMIEILRIIGISSDLENCYHTDSPSYRALTQSTFIELFEKGLIYEATRPNNFCTNCRTTLADADVIYETRESELFYINFKLKDSEDFVTIATTRPELLCSCQALIFNPEDKRYYELANKKAIVPIYEREVPILTHHLAQPKFGTGILMVCSYGDYEDVMVFRDLKLEEIISVDENGRMSENAGKYKGLSVKEAREKIAEELEEKGYLLKREKIFHRKPLCERCNSEIEIIPMKEFYLKQLYLKKDLMKLQKRLKFLPEMHRQLLIDWINSLSKDWPISRRRFYATEIPIWYCSEGHINLPEKGRYYRPWIEKAPFEKCKFCESREFFGEERVFDTWFDSSISFLFISKYSLDEKFFEKSFPNFIRPQGKDIIRTWLYYSILRSFQLTKKLPWKIAWIMGYGVDEKGEKMSKSKGNVLDPLPFLEKYGADTFRFWNASESSLGYDFRCSEQRIQNAGKFIVKLWNIAKYVSKFEFPKKARLLESDKWILSELNNLIKDCLKGYKNFNFFIPSLKIKEFAWNLFADHYIELTKPRAYGEGFEEWERKACYYTLHTCLKNILLLLAPITPFITEYIWLNLYSEKSIHFSKFPKPKFKYGLEKFTIPLINFNSKVWSEKKNRNISLKARIKFEIPEELKIFEKDLIAMHNIEVS